MLPKWKYVTNIQVYLNQAVKVEIHFKLCGLQPAKGGRLLVSIREKSSVQLRNVLYIVWILYGII